jgi:RNA polymerase sigma-70 factor, ECF subfamily
VFSWPRGGGGSDEFEATALPHLDALYRSALRLTHNRAEAEDLVQETYLKAFKGFHRFNPGTNCRAWLFTILRNTFLNRVRGAGRVVSMADTVTGEGEISATREPTVPDNPEEEFFQTVLHGDVDRALRTLPVVFREAVVLTDLEGMSYREAAEVLGCPIGTVMSRLSRGRLLLRRALADFAREHGYSREAE